MALLHQATLESRRRSNSFRRGFPHQPWLGDANASTVEAVGAYRFDDPDGEVGMEARTYFGRQTITSFKSPSRIEVRPLTAPSRYSWVQLSIPFSVNAGYVATPAATRCT